MIEYRKASQNDIENLSAMRVSMLCENGHYDSDFQERLFKNTLEYLNKGISDNSVGVWVATSKNEIIAMCCLSYFHLPPNELCMSGKSAHLGNMYTVPSFRNKGIASKLLEIIVAEAKKNQCERIVLVPTKSGKPIYEKFGFVPWFDAMVFFPTK